MKTVLVAVMFLVSGFAQAGEIFGELGYEGDWDALHNGRTPLSLGAAFHPTDKLDIEVVSSYHDSKVLRQDFLAPDDTWSVGVRARYNFFQF